jgi:hypothetical protein
MFDFKPSQGRNEKLLLDPKTGEPNGGQQNR